jgi:protein AFG1
MCHQWTTNNATWQDASSPLSMRFMKAGYVPSYSCSLSLCQLLTKLQAKLVLTSETALTNLFMSDSEVKNSLKGDGNHSDLSDAMRSLMDDLGMSVETLKKTSIFSGDEERFAFARALSRLSEMGSKEWVERGMGLGMSPEQSKEEREAWLKTRSHWSEDNM